MNAIEYIRNLEAVGIPREQAEVHARGLTEIMEEKFATKQDLRGEIQLLRSELKAEIQQVRTEMNSEFKLIRSEMRELENRLTHNLTIRLGSIMAGGLAFFSVFITLLEHFLK